MKNSIYLISALLLVLISCSKSRDIEVTHNHGKVDYKLEHGMIELGKKLEDPYSLSYMQKAYEKLYPTKAANDKLQATNIYVRFLPKSIDEYKHLVSLGIDLFDHPLDYEIIKDGDYYRDPDLSPKQITWQYAVLPKSFILPKGIRSEILDDCYIPANELSTRADGVDWTAVEDMAYRLSGNEDMLSNIKTRAWGEQPSGRITIEDEEFAGGKAFGVAGVKVLCNVFVHFASAYTDKDGYYRISDSFIFKPRYRLMFQNVKNFDIGLNLLIIPSSFSALGVGPNTGIDYHITSNSDAALYRRSVVNNTVYEYIEKCESDAFMIKRPPLSYRLWILPVLKQSISPMFHQGVTHSIKFLSKYLIPLSVFAFLAPDTILALSSKSSYKDIYASTLKECAKSSMYQVLGSDFWLEQLMYQMNSFLRTRRLEGDGSSKYSGRYELIAMWSDFIMELGLASRYAGLEKPNYTDKWYNAQIFHYLYDRGFTTRELFNSINSNINSLKDLQSSLSKLYPERVDIIDECFNRYASN